MDAAGIILSEPYLGLKERLIDKRTLAALPFASKYRLIDFSLSNMVNAGIRNVGLIEEKKYNSLMHHVRSGQEWDLDRKHGGLTYLPPSAAVNSTHRTNTRLEALLNNCSFLRHTSEDYIVMCGTGYVGNINFQNMLDFHIEKKADITYFFSHNAINKPALRDRLKVKADDDWRIISVDTSDKEALCADMAMATCVVGRDYLLDLLDRLSRQSEARSYPEIITSLIQTEKVMAYTTDEMVIYLDDLPAYLSGSLALLRHDVQQELFHSENGPIITKTKDSPATRYGENAEVVNSLIADGSTIEGSVENCIIFRGARIKEGAVVRNSVIMQESTVGEDAFLNYAVLDKQVIINDGRTLSGYLSHPFYCGRNEII